ncbi:POT family MFS transporter [Haloferula chungangensis]|uniref:POT family MFS transporter n=1 Tax=Haloferula chungangensis TaxID=1048331 RepID=A0ABW2LDA7_9BACT
MSYRTSPADLTGMPPGVPHIIGNEAAERFSFYGMKAVLAVFMANYLHLMDGAPGAPMSTTEATAHYHQFNFWVYVTPIFGALLADIFLGKYRTIILLSIVYCLGHAALAFMGTAGYSGNWLIAGLALIAIGSGGIKPCVSAHVGDQFGSRNAHLLPRIFNWFYFSINIGAFVSMLLTPWLLQWYGPHWAFGVPGVLMALATFVFWLGRHRFIHVPAHGLGYLREMFSRKGLPTLLRIAPLYLFVAIFWALFDQTGSTWIFQSQDMDRRFLGMDWLPSQIQSINSVFVLTFIPLFAYVVYPAISRIWTLTPLRKISLGLFIMATSFALIALIQQWIDDGQRPNISWQILAYALLTISEVMVSIVALEFAYTQSPRTMKSTVMCFYLLAVALGNQIVAQLNHYIQIPSAAHQQLEDELGSLDPDWRDSPRNVILPGHDGTTGTDDDFIARIAKGGASKMEIPGGQAYERTATKLRSIIGPNDHFPEDEAFLAANGHDLGTDLWGNPIRYERLNATNARLISAGPDNTPNTLWDQGYLLTNTPPEAPAKPSWTDKLHPETTWLERRQQALGLTATGDGDEEEHFTTTAFSGGQVKLQGAAYFRLFTWLMLGTAIAFIPFALLYKPRDILQD